MSQTASDIASRQKAKRLKQTLPEADEPPPFTKAEAHAMRMLMLGEASADQQQTAWNWIVNQASMYYQNPARFKGDNATLESFFMMGRAFVGGAMVTLAKMPTIEE